MDESLAKFIKDYGLTDSKWTNLFVKEGITTSEHISEKWGTEEVYVILSSYANEKEKEALQEIFGVHLDEVPGGQDWDIGRELQKSGLDAKHWLPIFSKQLGVTSLPALRSIGIESLPILDPFISLPSEKQALRKLISVDVKDYHFEILREKQREKLMKRQAQAQELLQELCKLQKDGKNTYDIRVQHCEQGIREMLQVSPATWPKYQNLQQLTERLQENFKHISILLDAKELSDVSLLQTASSGLGLQGVLLSRVLQEQLQDRSKLLKAPKNVQLSITDHPQSERILSFFSEDKLSLLKKSVEKLGYSAITSQPICELYSEHSQAARIGEIKYCISAKYCSIPLASYFFTDVDLQLSEEAIDYLSQIELALKAKDGLQEMCENFFNTFGSHIYRGPLTFGGIFWQKWHIQNNDKEQSNEGAICEAASFKYSVSQSSCEVSLSGGPEHILDLPEWKAGLAASNTTWKLIDRGTSLVPVWNIIEMNCESQFVSKSKLAFALQNAWKTMTSISSETQLPIQHLIAQTDVAAPSSIQEKCSQSQSQYTESLIFFQPLMDCINSSIESIKCAQKTNTDLTHVRLAAANAVTKEIQLVHQLKFEHLYEIFLLDTVTYPLKFSPDDSTLRILSLHDLEYLGKYLKDEVEALVRIKQKNLVELRAQVHLFKLAINIYLSQSEVDIINEMQILKHLNNAKLEFGDQLEASIANILMTCFKGHTYDWRMLKSQLQTLSEKLQLFERLQLDRYYFNKMSLKDALLIRKQTLNGEKCTEFEELPLFILQKIMAFDYRCRINVCCEQLDDLDSEEDSDPDEDTNLAESLPDIHPMDSLLAVIHCSNDFLRQDLMARLSTCQLSIPLLLPDPFTTNKISFSLWTLRSIIKEWKQRQGDTNLIERECPIITYIAPIVSFLRVGEQRKLSKSSILNQVISSDSDNVFNHFHHRDCEGAHSKQLLSGGLVEMCWYLPSGKPDDEFSDVVTFLNLRGDAKDHPLQTAFLCDISFMCFILLSEKSFSDEDLSILQNLRPMPGGLVLLLEGHQVEEKIDQIPQQVQCIKIMNKNPPAIKKYIQRKIKKTLKDKWKDVKHEMKTLDECNNIASKHGFCTDKGNSDFVEGQRNADNLLKLIIDLSKEKSSISVKEERPRIRQEEERPSIYIKEERTVVSVKEEMLPLQGSKLWHEWAKLDKEEHRQTSRGKETIEEYSSKVREKKKAIRIQQVGQVRDLPPLMTSFIAALSDQSGDIRRYFLQCLKLGLNELSRNEITFLRQEYNRKKTKLCKLQDSKDDCESEVEQCKKEIEELQEKLINASFGVEHLLREVGQVYEAVTQSAYKQQNLLQFSHLPGVAAELLIDGDQIELMDGDAAHVPLTWITAVLHELSIKLKDPRIFVLSVLGLQSTGKSTLMNTTFGLQFNVSAGRCTRGALIQLLPVDKSLSRQLNCNYVLIVDTEGLRAPSLTTSQKHDNQLATFVIGLANVTMINIFGETPGDIDDILQTAVYAFLRMKHVKLALSCQFVHQNVNSITASSKGGIGRYKFKEKLDEMTCEAAKEENCEGQYKYFHDIIKFDDRRDVHYFPSLWKGDPPMAPVNHGYSERAQELKLKIVNLIKSLGSSQLVYSFQLRIQDLWNALLNENFVFSFKNTMEVIAYNSLDRKWSQWAWEFQHKMLEWEHTVQNEIYSSDTTELNALYAKHLQELPVVIDETVLFIQEDMKVFFEESKYCDILIQWQQEARLRLVNLSEELKTHAVKYCSQLKSIQQALAEVKSQKEYYRERLLTRVKQLVSVSSKELSEAELKKYFDEQWMKWKKEIQSMSIQQVTTSHDEIISSVETSILKKHKSSKHNLIKSKLRDKPLIEWGEALILVVKSDVHFKLSKNWIVKQVAALTQISKTHKREAQAITNSALDRAQEYLEKKRNQRFNSVYTGELLEYVLDPIASENLEFNSEYKIDLSLIVCGYAAKHFIDMDRNFWKQNSPIEYFEQEMHEHLFSLFKSQCHKTALEKATAETFCEVLTKPIERQILDSLSGEIVNDMMDKHRYLHTKSSLKAKVLIDLAEEFQDTKDFRDYALYLTDAKRSLQHWIKLYTKRHCESLDERDTESRLIESLTKAKLSHLVVFISRKVEEVTLKLKTPKVRSNDVSEDVNDYVTSKGKEDLSTESHVNSNTTIKENTPNDESKDAHYSTAIERKTPKEEENESKEDVGCTKGKEKSSESNDCYRNTGETNIETWLEAFCTNDELKKRLKFDTTVFQDIGKIQESGLMDIENFTEEVQRGLETLKIKLITRFQRMTADSMDNWNERPYEIIYERLRGCCEQCPFCKEQCEYTFDNHSNPHTVQQHRPQCLGGYRWVASQQMMTDTCNALVAGGHTFKMKSDSNEILLSYKDYQLKYPRWFIPASFSPNTSTYWKWFVAHHMDTMADHFGAKPATVIPSSWRDLEWDDVKKDLERQYNIEDSISS